MTTTNHDYDEYVETHGTNRLQNPDPDRTIFRYAEEYDRERAAHDDPRVQRILLFRQLDRYRRFLVGEGEPTTPMETWTPLQRTIHYASIYAEQFVESQSPSETVEEIKVRLTEENRFIPHGVAEWVVERVRDQEAV